MSDEVKKQQEPKEVSTEKPDNTAAKPAEAKKQAETAEKVKKEKPTNCIVCNKAYKHKRWYYKNGKYFCTKRCWTKFSAEIKAKAAEAKAKESEPKTEQQSA